MTLNVKIKIIEFHLDIISYSTELVFNKIGCSCYIGRVVKADVQAMFDMSCKYRAGFIGISAYRYYIIPFLGKVLPYIFGSMFGYVYAYFTHYRYGIRVYLFNRMCACRTDLNRIIQ